MMKGAASGELCMMKGEAVWWAVWWRVWAVWWSCMSCMMKG